MDKFKEENDLLFKKFLEMTFWKGFRNKSPNWDRLELMFDTNCSLGCVYCYYNHPKHEKRLYPIQFKDSDKYVKNALMLIQYLHDNGMVPRGIDIFGGEPTIKKEFYDIVWGMEKILSDEELRKLSVVVPSNYSFLLSKYWTDKMIDILENSKVRILLSASIDGKYLESMNRPLIGKPEKDPRNDEWYDRLFEFNKKYGFGFHPMIYSQGIELWKKNFLWFQDMFDKHGIDWTNIYLLEVRNPEWSREQIKEFGKFLEFLVKWTFENRCDSNVKRYTDFIFKARGFNILNIFGSIGRGLGCSVQSMLYVRLSDLAIVPCHRTSYDEFIYGRFVVDGDKIVDIESKDVETFIAIYSLDSQHQPYCEQCSIKEVCSHGCLGAQYEFTGDLFTPIPTVCALEHMKIYSIIKATKEIGAYEYILSKLGSDKVKVFRRIEEVFGLKG